MRRKNFARIVCIGIAATMLAGCTGGGPGDKEQPGSPDRDSLTFVSEDYKPGNATVMKTEQGYYYYSDSEKGFRYYDPATGKDMFLCNKPECRHDGNEFCAATNDKYVIDRVTLYGGKLFATAIEQTETQILYHLLAIALDGSELDEVVTFLTLEKTGVEPAIIFGERELYLHRNMAMVPMLLTGNENGYHGTAIINLDTKEVKYLDEEPVAVTNAERTDMTAYGDFFYYCQKEGKKTVLHRYNITDGTDETHKLLVGFQGNYVVQDDNTIVYTKSDNRILCVFHRETGENEEKVNLTRREKVYYSDGTFMIQDRVYEAADLRTDGENIYVIGKYMRRVPYEPENAKPKNGDEAYVHVYDRELNEVTYLNMAAVMEFAEEVRPENPEEFYMYYNRALYFEGDEVYCVLPNANNGKEEYLFQCSKDEFLTGEPKFEFVMIY